MICLILLEDVSFKKNTFFLILCLEFFLLKKKKLFSLNTRRKVGNAYSFPDKQIQGISVTVTRSEISESDSNVNTEQCPTGETY